MRKKIARKKPITEQDIMPFEERLKPERFQVLILLAQGYSDGQMAAYLEVPPGTIKSRLSRARVDLRKLMTEEETKVEEFYNGHAVA